ncbi:hypothetical protein pb186bvf_014838, partial [Paramecium bursaria]
MQSMSDHYLISKENKLEIILMTQFQYDPIWGEPIFLMILFNKIKKGKNKYLINQQKLKMSFQNQSEDSGEDDDSVQFICYRNIQNQQKIEPSKNQQKQTNQSLNYEELNCLAQSFKKNKINHYYDEKPDQLQQIEKRANQFIDQTFDRFQPLVIGQKDENYKEQINNLLQQLLQQLKNEFKQGWSIGQIVQDWQGQIQPIQQIQEKPEILNKKGRLGQPFNDFKQLSQIEESGYYYLKFDNDDLKLYIDVQGSDKWIRLWYKDNDKVKGIISAKYITKNFSKIIMENFQCLGISTSTEKMNTQENWIIQSANFSYKSKKSGWSYEEIFYNLLNGQTPDGYGYDNQQKSSLFLYLVGIFQSYTLKQIRSTNTNYNDIIELQMGGFKNP